MAMRRSRFSILALAAAVFAAGIIVVPAEANLESIGRPEIGALRGAATEAGQTDAFYLQRFREGIKSYQEARYDDASRALEIALFGLASDKPKLAECLVYAGLSAHHRKNEAKSREYLLRARSFMDSSGVEKPALSEPDSILLDKLLTAFKTEAGSSPVKEPVAPSWTTPKTKVPEIPTTAPAVSAAKTPPAKAPAMKAPEKKAQPAKSPPAKTPAANRVPEAAPPVKKAPAKTTTQPSVITTPPPVAATKPGASPIADLEKRLLAEPGNAAMTYELATAHLESGDPAKARRLLEPYLVKQPEDYGAVFLLAKANYQLRRLKPAFEGFHALSSPRVQGELPPDTALKAGVYRALCLFRQGDRVSLPSAFAMVSSGVTSEILEAAISAEGLTADWAALRKAIGR